MGKKQSKPEFEVIFGNTFNKYYNNYPETTLDCIDDFIEHFESRGLKDWKGKIAPSYRVPENYNNRDEIIEKAKNHNLWHVHIGDPSWEKSKYGNYYVSEWVLHFKMITPYKIKLLELGWHNPMLLPSDEICNE
ncbi:MAG: hypothetical protein GAK29_04735 [Acinetobacter bereziniae]|uniref:Uncharacterized protein n=1 Tax=Acinetobacter bereziniae TaxID=106648 RepID=A0A833PAJ7_ACIBZ|nr:MAG: hypothetical protein GAK29_04735 [Acinetobacter bereziniae]